MKKISTLLLIVFYCTVFSQIKETEEIILGSNMSAKFTLNNTTNKVSLILKGPVDRWFAIGLNTEQGFAMGVGDAIVYESSLTDRFFRGTVAPGSDTQDWMTISDQTQGTIRTLSLERALTNSDGNDFQMPFATTNAINLSWAVASSARKILSSAHNVGFATGTFSTLGVEDFSLNASSIFPNPANDKFYVHTKTNLTQYNLYNQLGALVQSVAVTGALKQFEIDVNGLQSGVYFLELQNESEKSWKKVVIE